jgi:hypothetical protein
MLKDDGKGDVNFRGGSDIDAFEISFKIESVFFVIVEDGGFGLGVHPPVDEILKDFI